MSHFSQLTRLFGKSRAVNQKEPVNAINVGCLELNSQLDIVHVHNIVCHKLLGEKELVNVNFAQILSHRMSQERYRQLDSVFDALLKKQDITQFDGQKNPFDCIKIRIVNNHGIQVTRYLRCEFERHADFLINGIWLVTIRDVSRAVRISREIKLSRTESDLKINTVMSLIQFEKDLIEEFLEDTVDSMKTLVNYLKSEADSHSACQTKLELIYGIAHQIKGDASMLNLDVISGAVHEFESSLASLNCCDNLTNAHFKELRQSVKIIVNALKEVNTIFDKLREGGWNESVKEDKENKNNLVRQLNYLIKKIALDNHKHVVLVTEGDLDNSIPAEYNKIIGKLLTQLTRNAIVHGIEDIDTRLICRKTPYGCIHVFTQHENGKFILRVRDDGAGINLRTVKKAALISGLFPEENIPSWNSEQTINALFKPGFSTAKELTEHAGRGIGLDVIKSAILKYDGKVSVDTAEGKFTEFLLEFPASQQ